MVRRRQEEYSYDAMQHLTQVQSLKSDGTTNLAKFDYSYNTRDVRTSVEKQIGANTAQTVNYTYDTTDQLTKELSTETTPVLNKEYSYDAMGNRITSSVAGASTSYTSNNLNQVTQTTLGGNNTAITYDANGNTIQQGNKTFGYNDADQLTSVVIPNQKKSEFVYDSDGRKRISKEYTWNAAANGGAGGWTQSDETRFVYDGMDLVQERAADGTVKASYVRDGNIGGVLSMTNADGTFTYHYDGSGNVVALTDANQNIVAQYSYDAFGNTLSASGAQAEKNPFRFSSKYYDGETGLYDYGYRHYDSSLGRWINRDPIGEEGGINLYGMVANNPINAVDPYGLRKLTALDLQRLRQLSAYAKANEGDVAQKGLMRTVNGAIRAIKAAIAAVAQGQSDPVNLKAALMALNNLGNAGYAANASTHNGVTSDVPAGKPKCNIFVADVYGVGAGIGFGGDNGYPTRRSLRGNIWPYVANDLGNAATAVPNFPVTTSPRVGDIIGFYAKGGIGHSGINLGGGAMIYASNAGVKVGTIAGNREFENGVWPVYREYQP
jgi:RHS repeat-associated protein